MRKFLFGFSCLMALACDSSAMQLQERDSLIHLLETVAPSEQPRILKKVALLYFQTDPETALEYIHRLGKFGNEHSDTVALLDSKILEAEYNWRKSNYERAVELSVNALRLTDHLQTYNTQRAQAYQTIAIVHLYQLNGLEAIKNFREASSLYLSVANNKANYSVLNNMGVVFMDMAENNENSSYYDSAAYYFTKVIEGAEKVEVSTRLLALGNLASVYQKQNNDELALETYLRAEALETQNRSLSFQAMVFGAIGNLYVRRKQYQTAHIYYQKGLNAALALGSRHEAQEYYQNLANLYESEGNYREALNYSKQVLQLRDSVFNLEKSKAISELQTQYESEKKQREIELLQAEKEVAALQIQQDSQLRYFLVSLAALLAISVGLVYNRYLTKNRNNRLLDKKNAELAHLNATKDQLFSIISHDLRGPLSSFSTITESLSANMDHLSKEDIKGFVDSMRDASRETHATMENLLRWAMNQTGSLQVKRVEFDLHTLVDQVVGVLETPAKAKQIAIENMVPAKLNFQSDPDILRIIIRNLVSNAVKYSPVGGKVSIGAAPEKGCIVSVNDQGFGMKPEHLALLFNPSEAGKINNSTDKGTGIGLALCKELAERLGATLEVNSIWEKGSTFQLRMQQI